MKGNILILNKKEGETPLETLESFRLSHYKYKQTKMTYAGRLDPMASGLLLVLCNEAVKDKQRYLNLDKEYNFSVLFGFQTDTYDILGKIVPLPHRQELWGRLELEKKIKENLKFFTRKFTQKYPLFSGKTVKGKKLFQYGREGENVILPEREVLVKKLRFIKIRERKSESLLANIEKRIKKVEGDFRQNEILKIWRKHLSVKHPMFDRKFFIADFKIKCSSGTYVRGIANGLGEKVGVPALAFSIVRTKIGKWTKAG